jgi:hypothetical protein
LKKLQNLIQESKERYKNTKDHCLIWDTIKAEIRGRTISHAVHKSKQRKELEKKLNIEMAAYESKLAIDQNENTQQQYNTTKRELENINNHITRGIMIRAQAKHIELNEVNSKLFLGLERSKAKIKNISSLIVNDKIITDHNKILETQKTFYENLYENKMNYQSDETMEAKKYFLDQDITGVTEQDQLLLECEITDYEIACGLKELPTHKSPG